MNPGNSVSKVVAILIRPLNTEMQRVMEVLAVRLDQRQISSRIVSPHDAGILRTEIKGWLALRNSSGNPREIILVSYRDPHGEKEKLLREAISEIEERVSIWLYNNKDGPYIEENFFRYFPSVSTRPLPKDNGVERICGAICQLDQSIILR